MQARRPRRGPHVLPNWGLRDCPGREPPTEGGPNGALRRDAETRKEAAHRGTGRIHGTRQRNGAAGQQAQCGRSGYSGGRAHRARSVRMEGRRPSGQTAADVRAGRASDGRGYTGKTRRRTVRWRTERTAKEGAARAARGQPLANTRRARRGPEAQTHNPHPTQRAPRPEIEHPITLARPHPSGRTTYTARVPHFTRACGGCACQGAYY